MVDLEPGTAPAWIDSTDPILAGGYLRRLLPRPFQMARCVVQLSSGAGVKPGLRAHLWFWLARPLVKDELERLLDGVPGLDKSTLRPRQLHYTTSPIFDGVDDPVHERIALLPGLAEAAVGDLSAPVARPCLLDPGRGPAIRRAEPRAPVPVDARRSIHDRLPARRRCGRAG